MSRRPMLRMESWNTLAEPWNVPVMVAGRMSLGGLLNRIGRLAQRELPAAARTRWSPRATGRSGECCWDRLQFQMGDRIQWNQLAGIGLQIEQFQRILDAADTAAAVPAEPDTDCCCRKWWRPVADRRRRTTCWRCCSSPRPGAAARSRSIVIWICGFLICRSLITSTRPGMRRMARSIWGACAVEFVGVRAVKRVVVG